MSFWMVKVDCYYQTVPHDRKTYCKSCWIVVEAESSDRAMIVGSEFSSKSAGMFNVRWLLFKPMEAIGMTLPIITKTIVKTVKAKSMAHA